MSDIDQISWETDGQLQVLTFAMQGETFAIEAGMVQEILDWAPETPVPGSDGLVGGLINFRGSVIPIADLHSAFDLKREGASADSRIIVIEFDMEGETCLIGLKADKVHEVTTLTRTSAEAAPRIGMRWRQDYIRCLAKRDGDFIFIPDLDRIFAQSCGRTGSAANNILQAGA